MISSEIHRVGSNSLRCKTADVENPASARDPVVAVANRAYLSLRPWSCIRSECCLIARRVRSIYLAQPFVSLASVPITLNRPSITTLASTPYFMQTHTHLHSQTRAGTDSAVTSEGSRQ
ncbi:hypothetical protein BC939DRAFT_137068 [Gamsiella multidivaricata]|uniref:uncharacterized protein n=1 Tax=Gamsiella multidivaricata TaxID=101098 RepID=UPI002220641C|nr:uncharacterized protein BC939DRAFT_137068 [Gamsiella multidivaricata]KAI7824884.1 hypothetical protein BC939DRAFT_137068 [Gamsiella multidivaricata]